RRSASRLHRWNPAPPCLRSEFANSDQYCVQSSCNRPLRQDRTASSRRERCLAGACVYSKSKKSNHKGHEGTQRNFFRFLTARETSADPLLSPIRRIKRLPLGVPSCPLWLKRKGWLKQK